MAGRKSTSRSSRALPLTVVTGSLASVLALLWFFLGDDVAQVEIFPGCVPSAEASSGAARIPIAKGEAAPESAAPKLEPAPIPKAAPLIEEAPQPTSALTRVQGIVVDARTKEPVPEIAVALRSGNVSDRVETGPDGSFESSREFPAGTLSAMVYDAGHNLARFEREHAALSIERGWLMEVPIGPTYPLQVALPDAGEASTWSARIVETIRDPGSAGEIDVTASGLRMSVDLEQHPDREWSWMPLREGVVPWLRYSNIEFQPDANYPLHLELRSEKAPLDGTALVRSTVGIQPQLIVKVAASPASATLTGEVTSDAGGSQAEIELMLLPYDFESGVTKHGNVWDQARPDVRGHFTFRRVYPGDKVLLAFASNHVLERRVIRLYPGQNSVPKIQLTRAVQAFVSVDLSASSIEVPRRGRPPAIVRLRLAEAGSAARAWLVPGRMDRSSSDWHGSVIDLPAADFELTQIGIRGPPMWKPYAMSLTAPYMSPELLGLSSRDAKALSFDIRLAGSRAKYDPFAISFGPGGCMLDVGAPQTKPQWLLPADLPLEWSVWWRGYAPQFGTDKELQDVEGKRALKLELERGWGAAIYLRCGGPSKSSDTIEAGSPRALAPSTIDLLSAPALPGVIATADRETLATSDAEGALRLSTPRTPKRISLRCDGWHLTALTRIQLQAGARPGRDLEETADAIQMYLGWMQRDGEGKPPPGDQAVTKR